MIACGLVFFVEALVFAVSLCALGLREETRESRRSKKVIAMKICFIDCYYYYSWKQRVMEYLGFDDNKST